MGINSCVKGKVGERELANFFKEKGYTQARRGQQYEGSSDSPDVLVPELHQFHFESKRVEAGNPYNWLDQAIADAGEGKVPVVAHRRNRREWIAVLRLEDLMALIKKGNTDVGK